MEKPVLQALHSLQTELSSMLCDNIKRINAYGTAHVRVMSASSPTATSYISFNKHKGTSIANTNLQLY